MTPPSGAEQASATPLGDALAAVERAQAEVQHNWSRSADAGELAALRGLAEVVRGYVAAHPETERWGSCKNCGKPALTPQQLGWGDHPVHVLDGTVHCMDGSRELATVAELAAGPEPVWTVIGVWEGDEPIPAGVISGRHEVSGGDGASFPQGLWATSVSAPEASTAEARARAEMLGGDDEDGEER